MYLLSSWEHNPWTACSASCGGGIQKRSFVCVEESMHGEILQVEEWKCMYAPKPKVMQPCNLFDCPKWIAMDWSQVRRDHGPLLITAQIVMNICYVVGSFFVHMPLKRWLESYIFLHVYLG